MTVKYTNRTCDKCGARRPQPEMVRKEVYVETGKSTATISTNTWIGVMGGDKGSERAVKRALFNNGERTYTRKKTVWSCRNCNAPSGNYSLPSPKVIKTKAPAITTNTHKLDSVSSAVNADTKNRSLFQKIVDLRPRTFWGWVVLIYAAIVVIAMLDGG